MTALLQHTAPTSREETEPLRLLEVVAPSAGEIADIVRAAFPAAELSTDVDEKRQGIVDSWPADVDDSAARRDWGLAPRYDLRRAFQEYLIPTIRERYRQ